MLNWNFTSNRRALIVHGGRTLVMQRMGGSYEFRLSGPPDFVVNGEALTSAVYLLPRQWQAAVVEHAGSRLTFRLAPDSRTRFWFDAPDDWFLDFRREDDMRPIRSGRAAC